MARTIPRAPLGGGSSSGGILEYHEDIPVAPNATVQYRGWVPVTAELTAIRVYMQVLNTVGTYVLSVQNEATGNPCVLGTTFNMNSLVATTVTSVALVAVPADLQFAAQGKWTIALTSNNAGFDGSGIYVELEFAHGTAGLSGQDLTTTLGFGNATGGTDIVLSSSDEIVGEAGLSLAGNAVVRGGTATGGVANGGDVLLRPGEGAGGGADGAVIVRRADGTASVRLVATAAQTLSIGTTLPMVFDGATGKLTVPGIIDPTAVVFEEAAPPTTGATEGAVFVSDGTGDQILGDLYYRGPSNETPTNLTTGGGVRWFGTTTDATPTNLFLDNVSAQYVLPAQSAVKFTWEIVARSSGNDVGAWKLSGVVKRNVGVATVAQVGTETLEITAVDAALAAATVTVYTDVATGAFGPRVTGIALTNIKWVVVMTEARVSG